MNLISRILVLEFAVTFGTFDTMFCVIVLSSCQQVTVEGLNVNLIHRLLSLEFTIALGALYRTVGRLVVLRNRISTSPGSWRWADLIPIRLCRKFIVAFGAFEAVFCVVVLRKRQ